MIDNDVRVFSQPRQGRSIVDIYAIPQGQPRDRPVHGSRVYIEIT
jgi:hypothetical protein